MRKPFSRTLSLALSLMLAFGCFAVVPASAVEVDENGKVGNVTLVDYGAELPSYTNVKSFSDRIANLNVESQFEGTTLKLSEIGNQYLEENYPARNNLIVAASYRAAQQTDYSSLAAVADYNGVNNITDGRIFDEANKSTYDYTNSYWYKADLKSSFDPSENVGAARKENNNVDLYFTTTLSDITEINTIYYFGHPNRTLNMCTYEIYVGNDKGDDLYKADNLVAYYDYSKKADGSGILSDGAWTMNGDRATGARKSQGQIWNFTGENKPVGKYVGFKVYDACLDTSNNRLDIYDLGVFGERNLTLADAGDEGNTQTAKTFDEKAKYLNATADVDGVSLKLAGIDNAYLAANYGDKTGSVSGFKVQHYASSAYTTVSAADKTNMTDLSILDKVKDGTPQANGTSYGNAYTTLNPDTTTKGYERIKNNIYDAYLTAELKNETDISDIVIASHPRVYVALQSYELYVGDSGNVDELYKPENRVALFDYNAGYTAGIPYLFNGVDNSDSNYTSGKSWLSQAQVWKFNNAVKGKYVGLKIYDASSQIDNRGKTFDVFGTEIKTVKNSVKVETVSNSSKTANLMPATTTYAKDTEGNAADALKEGSTYTFGVNDTDARYNFEGWYKNGAKVSSDKEFTTEFDGTALVAKYTTDAILNINPLAGNELVWTQANGVVGAFAYDSAKNAYKFNTTTAGNSSIIGSLKYGNVNLLSNQYEANTTYKITVKGEVVDNTPDDGNDAAVKITLSPSVYGNLSSIGEYKPTAAFTATKYFYSGAADWGRDSNVSGDAVSTKFISTNSFNLSLVDTKKVDGVDTNYNLLNYADGDEFYITDLTIEKVNNLVVNADEGADVKVNNKVENRNIAFSTLTSDFLKANGNFAQSADITDTEPSFKDVVAKMKSDFAEANIKCGIANDDELSFTATAKDGYTVKSVSVNGKELTVAEDGKYTLSGSDIANGKTAGTGRFASDSVVVDVVTEKNKEQYTVSFVGKDGKEFYNTTVTEGEAVSADTIAAAAAKAPAIYGYTFKGFDKDAELQNVTANLTVTAVYEKAESTETYTVGYTGVNGKRFEKTGVKFDERVIVTDENAKYWTDGAGAVIAIGTTATIYGCADIELIAKADDAAAEPTATTLGFKTVAGTTSSFVVFGHINVPAGYTVTEKGVVFASKATDEAGEWGIDSAKTAKAVVTGTGVDFMGTLTGINAGKARAAKAYVVLSNGETTVTVYGAVVTAQF